MTTTVRRILMAICVAAGVTAAAAGPASAGLALNNHCEPPTRPAVAG